MGAKYDRVLEQRNEAARLYWRMKADRDGYRELYNETRTANAEVWGKVVKLKAERDNWIENWKLSTEQSDKRWHYANDLCAKLDAANRRIAELEAEIAEYSYRSCEVCAANARIADLEHKLTVAHVNRGDYEQSLLRIEELEAELAERGKRTCMTCAHWIDDDHQCDLGHNVNYIRYTNGIGGVRKHTPVDKFSCSEWQERDA